MFALNVLNNCGRRCVFCGLNQAPFGAKKMLLAGHIKPWKDGSATERLDLRNGLAACPSHDVAFDTGMLTVTADLKIRIAQPLADAACGDHLTGSTTAARRSWTPCCSRHRRTSQAKVPVMAPRESLRRLTSKPKCAPAS